ncbi:sigma factor [Paenibacillus amylolyticus]|uniref:RNA polymerase sigma factor n=1 Tax=Paenibacillus amylolyticus TaxID=1451 RepID=UPI003242877E
MYCFALSLSRNKQIAEEITQETFFKALKNINQFRGSAVLKSGCVKLLKTATLRIYTSKNGYRQRDRSQKLMILILKS